MGCEHGGILASQATDKALANLAPSMLATACEQRRGLACLIAAELPAAHEAVKLKKKARVYLSADCEAGKAQECQWLSEAESTGRLPPKARQKP